MSQLSTTQSEALAPASHRLARRVITIALGALVVAAAAQISVPLPFGVPMTLSPLAVLVVGGILGARRGGESLATYVALGAAGLPVFAQGYSGVVTILGPTGGYLLAFPVAAALTGWLARPGDFWRNALAATAGVAVIHLGGLSWLVLATGISFPEAFAGGTLPFVPGDVIKVMIAAALITGTAARIRRLL